MSRCLRLSSTAVFLLLCSCAGPYRHLKPYDAPGHPSALHFKPEFEKELYRCVVNGKFFFKKFHLSGILLFKKMPDSSVRAVFQNEMGFAFFDFEWDKHDAFRVNHITDRMNRDAVTGILQKDLELLMMKNLDTASESLFIREGTAQPELFHRFSIAKGYAYYITDRTSGSLARIENAGKKKVVTVSLSGKQTDRSLPGNVFFRHHKAHFTIELTKITEHAPE